MHGLSVACRIKKYQVWKKCSSREVKKLPKKSVYFSNGKLLGYYDDEKVTCTQKTRRSRGVWKTACELCDAENKPPPPELFERGKSKIA